MLLFFAFAFLHASQGARVDLETFFANHQLQERRRASQAIDGATLVQASAGLVNDAVTGSGASVKGHLGSILTDISKIVLVTSLATGPVGLVVGGVLAVVGGVMQGSGSGPADIVDAINKGFTKIGLQLDDLLTEVSKVEEDTFAIRTSPIESLFKEIRSSYSTLLREVQHVGINRKKRRLATAQSKRIVGRVIGFADSIESQKHLISADEIHKYLELLRDRRSHVFAALKFQEALVARFERFSLTWTAAVVRKGGFPVVRAQEMVHDLRAYTASLDSLGLMEWARVPAEALHNYLAVPKELKETVSKLRKDLLRAKSDRQLALEQLLGGSGSFAPVRYNAARELALIGAPAAAVAVPDLCKVATDDKHALVRAKAAEAIGAIGGPASFIALPSLSLALVTDTDERVRASVASVLINMKSKSTVQASGPAFWDPSSLVRKEAAEALANSGFPLPADVLPALHHALLTDEDDDVRRHVAKAYGIIEDSLHGTSLVQKILQDLRDSAHIDTSEEVRHAARQALRKLQLVVGACSDIPGAKKSATQYECTCIEKRWKGGFKVHCGSKECSQKRKFDIQEALDCDPINCPSMKDLHCADLHDGNQ